MLIFYTPVRQLQSVSLSETASSDFHDMLMDDRSPQSARAYDERMFTPDPNAVSSTEITIPIPEGHLPGTLSVPVEPVGLVLFAHGSGSSRQSPRNRAVAQILNASRIATLLFDLLTPLEDSHYETRFDIDLLSWRLVRAIEWARVTPVVPKVPLGVFGASTGAAAALTAAALLGDAVTAVVSRGGRPDLALESLPNVSSPSLFIVGGNDPEVEILNRRAQAAMRCESQVSIVPGAGHLFEEGRSLETVAGLAAGWFLKHFQDRRSIHEPQTHAR